MVEKEVARECFEIHQSSLDSHEITAKLDRNTTVTNNFLLLLCSYLNEFDMRQQCENSVKEK